MGCTTPENIIVWCKILIKITAFSELKLLCKFKLDQSFKMTVKYIYYYRLCDNTVLSFNFIFN